GVKRGLQADRPAGARPTAVGILAKGFPRSSARRRLHWCRVSRWHGRQRLAPSRRPSLSTPADEAAGLGAGVLVVLEDRAAGDEGRRVALGPLHQALAAGRQVVDDLGGMEPQAVEVDQVHVGALAGLEPAAVVEAEEVGGLAGLALHYVFERQALAALPVAAPMGQHVGRRAGVDRPSNVPLSVSISRIGS